MSNLFKKIPSFFVYKRPEYTIIQPNISDKVLKQTTKQFENAFIQITGHSKKQQTNHQLAI